MAQTLEIESRINSLWGNLETCIAHYQSLARPIAQTGGGIRLD
jgi:hypothetical protein